MSTRVWGRLFVVALACGACGRIGFGAAAAVDAARTVDGPATVVDADPGPDGLDTSGSQDAPAPVGGPNADARADAPPPPVDARAYAFVCPPGGNCSQSESGGGFRMRCEPSSTCVLQCEPRADCSVSCAPSAQCRIVCGAASCLRTAFVMFESDLTCLPTGGCAQ